MPIRTLGPSALAHAAACALAIALILGSAGAAHAQQENAQQRSKQGDDTCAQDPNCRDEWQSWELVVGPSFGVDLGVEADTNAVRADVWAGARFSFFEAGVFATSLRLDHEALAPGVEEGQANGRAVGLQIGLTHGFPCWDLSLRLGVHARYARAGLDKNDAQESEPIGFAGWAAQGLASVGVGNSTYAAYEPRWWIGVLGGVSAIWVSNVGAPWGDEARYDDQITIILGLGFEAGYNVPVD